MQLRDELVQRLDEENLFENSGHRTRFRELLDCFGAKRFFTPGVCKCMYMSAWDEEHFVTILGTLNIMSVGGFDDTSDMEVMGEDYAVHAMNTDETFMWQMSVALVNGEPVNTDHLNDVSPEKKHVYENTMRASAIIDEIL